MVRPGRAFILTGVVTRAHPNNTVMTVTVTDVNQSPPGDGYVHTITLSPL
jgi:hypothetical protein